MGKYRHLTPEDREQIAILRAADFLEQRESFASTQPSP